MEKYLGSPASEVLKKEKNLEDIDGEYQGPLPKTEDPLTRIKIDEGNRVKAIEKHTKHLQNAIKEGNPQKIKMAKEALDRIRRHNFGD
jgi:hypothetical protein